MTDTGRRVQLLQDQGHGWLEPDSQVALASAPTSDGQMLGAASAFRQALNASGNAIHSVSHFFGDPVLQKQPSTALALRQYLLQKQGWYPIEQSDLRGIQQQLVTNGYLDAGEVNGVWTPASAQAFRQATSDHIEHQQTHSGGFSIHAALGAFLPSHWIPAIVGAAKAFPGELRSLVGNLAGSAVTLGDIIIPTETIMHGAGFGENARHALRSGADVSRHIRGALGEDTGSLDEFGRRSIFGGATSDLVNNINTILTLAPAGKAASAGYESFNAARAAAANHAVNDAAGTGFLRGLGTDLGPEAAQRGPGVISKAIYARAENGNTTGLLGSRLFQQAPVFRHITAPIKAVYDPEGRVVSGYYAMRTTLAQPYRIAGVQAAGAATNQAALAGAAEQGIAAVESKAGAHHTALADQIHAQGLIGGQFGTALDILSGAMHGPLATTATAKAAVEGRQVLIGINPTQSVAALHDGAAQAIDAAYKPLNIGWALENGTRLGGNPITVEEMTDKYGTAFTQKFLNDKLNQFSAAHHAETALESEGLPKDSTEYMDRFKALSHEALHDAETLRTARDDMLGNMAALAVKFGQDSNAIHREARDLYRQGIDTFADVWHPATELFTKHDRELVGPHVLAQIKSAQEDRKFAETMGDTPVGPEPGAYRNYLDENHPGFDPGALGLARKAKPGQDATVETFTHRQHMDVAKELQNRLDAAGSASVNAEDIATAPAYNPAEIAKVKQDAINHLFTYRGLNYKELEGLDAQQLIDTVKDVAKRAPRDATLALDASPEATALAKKIEDAGYKIVVGTDIGHTFTPPVIDPVLIHGYNSRWRKAANVMGLNNIPVSVKEAGSIRRLLVERVLQAAINDGRLRVPPGMNAARLNMFLLQHLESRADLSPGEGIAFAASKRLHESIARDTLGENATAEQIAEHMQSQRAMIARGTQPLEVRPKEFVKALTQETPQPIKDALGINETLPLMDTKSAQLVYDLYVRAAAREPAWAFGAGRLEDLYRAGFGFLGSKASANVPVLRSLARVPNASIRVRNRYRFQLDPMFSMKRTVKSGVKASIPGAHGIAAPFTVRPFHYMVKSGTLEDDLATLNRVLPMKGAEGFDTNDRLLYEQDAFGIYNPRHHMALRAGELHRAGLDDATIAKDLARTFTYGDRTAFERTLGTIWYPFSFEKTLWRNVGSYGLDRPGSRLMAAAAFQAYSALGQHDGIDGWLKDHAPIMREFQKLNAFDHGIGPGQVGGINSMYAPALWNLFGPQKYGAMKEPQFNAVQNMFPVLRELNSLLVGHSAFSGTNRGGTLTGQTGIGLWALQHTLDRATTAIGLGHALDSPFNLIGKAVPIHGETADAEQTKAWAYRNSLIMALAPVLDFNYHNRNTEKVWGPTAPEFVRGKTINRSSIDEIVHSAFSTFDPSAAQSLAVTKKTQMDRYLTDLTRTDPQRATAYQQFTVPAEKLRPILQRAITNPDLYGQLANVESTFREYAINLAEQDRRFVKFYNQFYLSTFGPIEAVTA